ncbi:MAG: hypothetical protein FJ298_02460 [Planctomycetes bacterium]|nr:hypothetical protein [Planctomycetota bacterium]
MFSRRKRTLLLSSLLLSGSASAQNAFRPLPAVPEALEWSGSAPRPIPSLASYMDELERAAESPRPSSFLEARGYLDAVGAAGLEGGGDIAHQRGGWQVIFGTELDEARLAAFSLSTEAHFYDFSGAPNLVPGVGQPFNDLYRASFSGVVRTPEQLGMGWFGGFEFTLGGEDEASPADALVAGGVGGVHYVASERLEVDFGLAMLSRLEDDPWIWPFLGLKWRASDALTFEAKGTSVEARYALDPAWSLFARAEYQLRQFRLNDDNPLPGGVFRDEEVRAGIGVTHRSDRGFKLDLFGGLNVWRELSTLDSAGVKVNESEADPAPFVALSLQLSI